jgi:hypothetical protein
MRCHTPSSSNTFRAKRMKILPFKDTKPKKTRESGSNKKLPEKKEKLKKEKSRN